MIFVFNHEAVNYVFSIGWRSNPGLEFNLHPIAMSMGLVFLNGEAITFYRGFRNKKKAFSKTVHMILLGTAGLLTVFGLIVSFWFC